jgi:hypothetical protein
MPAWQTSAASDIFPPQNLRFFAFSPSNRRGLSMQRHGWYRKLPLVIRGNFGLKFAASLPRPVMISNVWRQRLIYTAMSAFVAWHGLAMAVAPMPERSATGHGLRALLQPYLTLLRLDNGWDFFSPIVFNMYQFRYVIEDQSGKQLTFIPDTEFSRLHPSYFWIRGWHNAIIDNPEDYADIAAAHYCQRQASLHPVAITLLKVEEKDFTPADLLAGKQRWDPEFLTISTIKHVKCPSV